MMIEEERLTEKDMKELLRSYDALQDLRKFTDVTGYDSDSVLERLSVSGVILRHTKGWKGDVEPWMMEVLEDRESSLEERARKLMFG